jgi:hypothetical protein
LDGLLTSLSRFSERLKVVERVRAEGLSARTARSWGPALVFRRLWERQSIPEILGGLLKHRGFVFDLERTAFAMALQRLCAPGSDLQGSHWIHTVEADGFEALSLQHFYRTAGFLAEQRLDLERELFFRDRDLFSQSVDLIFIDTTSLYVYRDTETRMRRRGYSRDRRGDLPQFVICVAVDALGWPIAWEIFPGNTADPVALTHLVRMLRERFAIQRAVVVADRGMISKATVDMLTQHASAPFQYVLGCRMRRNREIHDAVLRETGPFERVEENLEVREVTTNGRRYVVCRNPFEAVKDAEARAALVRKIEAALQHGPKQLVGNKGFARFLRVQKGSISIDQDAVQADAKLDGLFILTTNTSLPAAEVARAYKGLWRVERTFREEKSTLEVRPIYHQSDTNSVGHIVACFLALRLEVDLQRRLDEAEVAAPWPDLMRDLGQVQAVAVELDGQRYRLRTDVLGWARHAFAAAGVRIPSAVTPLGAVEPPAAELQPGVRA